MEKEWAEWGESTLDLTCKEQVAIYLVAPNYDCIFAARVQLAFSLSKLFVSLNIDWVHLAAGLDAIHVLQMAKNYNFSCSETL